MKHKALIIIALLAMALGASAAGTVTVTVKNPAPFARQGGEMVELDIALVPPALRSSALVVADAAGAVLPSQVTSDGKLIFPAPAMAAKETRLFTLSAEADYAKAHPDAAAALSQARQRQVFGRLYPERQEDFSFENDRLAYRLYGPDTQRRGERLYGYDIFNKRTSQLILDELYAGQCDGQMWNTVNKLNRSGRRDLGDDVYYAIGSYHVDHGKGMDCYKVGPTLGAGTCALIDGGAIVYPWCFAKAEVIDDGPLRLTVRLTYSPIEVRGQKVTETRLISLDAGSSMVKAVVTYDGLEAALAEGQKGKASKPLGSKRRLPKQEGLARRESTQTQNSKPKTQNPKPQTQQSMEWGAGIAVHKEAPEAYVISREHGFVAYEDRGDSELYIKRFRERLNPDMGSCFIACLIDAKGADCRYVPFEKETASALGHVMVSCPLQEAASQPLTYYFGNAWSRNTGVGIATMEQWQAYLEAFARQLRKPLQVGCRTAEQSRALKRVATFIKSRAKGESEAAMQRSE